MIDRAVQILSRGGLVAFPTETVYGLGADARNDDAVRRIFAVKGRPPSNPLIVHVADVESARQVVSAWPDAATRLADAFWPGPLTLVLPRAPSISCTASAGLSTIGVRVPAHPVAMELLQKFAGPVAAPSANRSNRVSPTTAQHVREEFGDAVDLILDGGPCDVGIESTVVDLCSGGITILRPGRIGLEQIREVAGLHLRPCQLAPQTQTMPPDATPRSPGQFPLHYAPKTPLIRFTPEQRPTLDLQDAALIELALDPETYERNLYARLRLLDAQALRAIYIELPPDRPEWLASRDRVLRASRPL